MSGQELTFTANTSLTGDTWVGDSVGAVTTGHTWIDYYPQTFPCIPSYQQPQYNYHYYPFHTYPDNEIYDKARKYDEIMKKHPKLKLEEKRDQIKALAKELGIKIKFV